MANRRPLANPDYGRSPLTRFEAVVPETPLDVLNLNWRERDLPERVRTKHVHRLHPYLGKFVPQLVEIFLRKYAPRVVLDPFVGCGTTLVEANALGVVSIGCDVAPFNCLISKVKTDRYDLALLEAEIRDILLRTHASLKGGFFCTDKASVTSAQPTEYLEQWFAPKALEELLTYLCLIRNYTYQDVMKVIVSRAARSARLTTHHQLDFPTSPQRGPYLCHKHDRICEPTDDALQFLRRYSHDTLRRIREFSVVRREAPVTIICGDSASVEFPRCDMVLTSPPYVGLIDYHDQHRYAYELLSLLPKPFSSIGWDEPDARQNESLEIGAASKGTGNGAKAEYRAHIEDVFGNAVRSLTPGGVMVVVVGDKYGLYGDMHERLGLRLDGTVRRHVNRRTGRRSTDFYETVLVWRRP